MNALCWPRTLSGDFAEIVDSLGQGSGIVRIHENKLSGLRTSDEGHKARRTLLEDLHLLREQGLNPELNCIHGYARDRRAGPVPTDVFSFHVDRAPVETYTWLCTYHGPASEGLLHEDAQRMVDLPGVRAEVLARFGGKDDANFLQSLSRNSYDLHYAPKPQARPFSFGVGNLWRVATSWPGSPVPPFVHRAPQPLPGQPARLLLIC